MSGSLSSRVFALLCENTLFDKEAFLRDDYQSADTNATDFKLLTDMMSQQDSNVNYCRLRAGLLNRHITLFAQIGINQIWPSDGGFINCVSTPAPVWRKCKSLLTWADVLLVQTSTQMLMMYAQTYVQRKKTRHCDGAAPVAQSNGSTCIQRQRHVHMPLEASPQVLLQVVDPHASPVFTD